MQRRILFACAGGLLAAGAPLGLLAVRVAKRDPWRATLEDALDEIGRNRLDYLYVGTSTALAFSLFGFMLGWHADRLAELSQTDPLTGLCNARGLFGRLETELARAKRYRVPLALLLVDLDGLKQINDRYGHRAGDEAIRTLADVIRSELRETDVGARWGGDEFAVLAPNTPAPAARALAERIRALISAVPAPWPLSGSIGVVTIDPRGDGEVVDSSTLMRAADAALYEAKRRGRNRVVSALPRDQAGKGIMAERDIVMTEEDAERLATLLSGVRERRVRDREHLQQLADEIDRARVVPATEIPPDVVTMNSELALRDLDTGEEMVFRVVFPSEANVDQGKVSVLAPLGTAVLGYREGDEIEWAVPGRTRRIRIERVLFQPEAAKSASREADEPR